MTGFTYRGLHSARDIGIVFKTRARPTLPPPRISSETVPYLDGSIDYSFQNGRIYYDDKVLELDIAIVGTNLKSLHEKINRVVVWLAGGYAPLIFDDMPLTVWNAMPISVDSIAPELARVGKTTVQFRCAPFNTAIFDSAGPRLGSGIPLGADIPIGYGSERVYTLTSGTNTIDFDYFCTAPSRPQLVFTDTSASAVSVQCNGRMISYIGEMGGLTINCANYTCLLNSADVSYNASGDFFEFAPDKDNSLNITINASARLEVIFELSYLYEVTGIS